MYLLWNVCIHKSKRSQVLDNDEKKNAQIKVFALGLQKHKNKIEGQRHRNTHITYSLVILPTKLIIKENIHIFLDAKGTNYI